MDEQRVGRDLHRLRSKVVALKRALRPFAIDTSFSSAPQSAFVCPPGLAHEIKLSDFQRAFDALTQPTPEREEVSTMRGSDQNAVAQPCGGCGQPLVLENAWMEDGCPCNTPAGVNNVPRPPVDPHDIEARTWFRWTLIAFCVIGFMLILVPPHWLEWPPKEYQTWHGPVFLGETCAQVRITHGQITDGKINDVRTAEYTRGTVWYDCTQTFSDGTVFRRIGDVKP